MTRFLPAIFLLLLASRACGSTVNLTWSYDYTGLPVCSATVTKNCMDHFEMHDATSGTPVLIAAVQNPVNASGKVTAITGTFQTSTLGQRTFAVTAVGRDNSGQPCLERLDEVPGDISGAAFSAGKSVGFGAVSRIAGTWSRI